MKALHFVILKSKKSYNNTESINGIDFTVNVNIDDVKSINREAIVVCAPEGSNLIPEDEVIVHHNIMRESIHTNGTLDKGMFFLSECHDYKYFLAPVPEILLKKVNGKWETLLDFVFIKPFLEKEIDLGSGITFVPKSRKGMVDLRGILSITNKDLKGVDIGDIIVFSRNSEHEFIIDGEIMYKCRIEDILAKV